MERSKFFDGQFVLPEDLNNIEITAIEQIKQRTQSLSGYATGVLGSVKDGLNKATNLFITKDSPVQVTLAPGSALDISGELIVVPEAKTMQYAISDDHYKWSSGYTSQTNYIKLRYQEASSSLKATSMGVASYTKFIGDYYISIDGIVNTSSEILLGTYTSDTSGGISGDITDTRTYTGVVTAASASVLDPTLDFNPWAHRNLEDHVRASGSGVPSNINAHGLTAADINAAANPSHIPLVPTFNNSLTLYEVYQNSSGSTMFLSCTVKMEDTENLGYRSWLAIMVAENGLIGDSGPGGPGYLTPPYYQLNTKTFMRLTTSADQFTVVASLQAFIPANWFYVVTVPLNEPALPPGYIAHSGTILNSLRYW